MICSVCISKDLKILLDCADVSWIRYISSFGLLVGYKEGTMLLRLKRCLAVSLMEWTAPSRNRQKYHALLRYFSPTTPLLDTGNHHPYHVSMHSTRTLPSHLCKQNCMHNPILHHQKFKNFEKQYSAPKSPPPLSSSSVQGQGKRDVDEKGIRTPALSDQRIG